MLKVARYGRRGLSLHAHYTYAHAMDWNPNESTLVAGSDVLDPANFSQEYGTSNLDVRHSAAAMVIYEAPWKLRGMAGKLGNGWMLSGIGQFRSGLPYTMRTSGSLAEEFDSDRRGHRGPGAGHERLRRRQPRLRPGQRRHASTTLAATPTAIRPPGRPTCGWASASTWGICASWNSWPRASTCFNHQNVTELETTGYYIESGTPATWRHSTSHAELPHRAEGQHHGLRPAAEHQRNQLLPRAADSVWVEDEVLGLRPPAIGSRLHPGRCRPREFARSAPSGYHKTAYAPIREHPDSCWVGRMQAPETNGV